jgi:hypothetical protein
MRGKGDVGIARLAWSHDSPIFHIFQLVTITQKKRNFRAFPILLPLPSSHLLLQLSAPVDKYKSEPTLVLGAVLVAGVARSPLVRFPHPLSLDWRQMALFKCKLMHGHTETHGLHSTSPILYVGQR